MTPAEELATMDRQLAVLHALELSGKRRSYASHALQVAATALVVMTASSAHPAWIAVECVLLAFGSYCLARAEHYRGKASAHYQQALVLYARRRLELTGRSNSNDCSH